MSLFDKIRKNIEFSGPIGIAEFMNICLYDKEFGYYINQKPIGKNGDFTTAPEISQIFGELIGIWVISAYYNLGLPNKFRLLELGAGRGTLLKDILRVLKSQGLDKNAKIEILEINNDLKKQQKANLCDYEIEYFENLIDIKPNDLPIIIIANEFFDCLPIRQYIKTENGWCERLIGIQNNELVFGLGPALINRPLFAKPDAENGTICENTIGLESHIFHISKLLKANNGHCLIIDYGHFGDEFGDSFQALKNHEKVSPLSNLGSADLTAHVNFGAIETYAIQNNLLINGPNTQRELLKALGIDERAKTLIDKNPKFSKEIEESVARLIDHDAMGDLFKAIILYCEK